MKEKILLLPCAFCAAEGKHAKEIWKSRTKTMLYQHYEKHSLSSQKIAELKERHAKR